MARLRCARRSERAGARQSCCDTPSPSTPHSSHTHRVPALRPAIEVARIADTVEPIPLPGRPIDILAGTFLTVRDATESPACLHARWQMSSCGMASRKARVARWGAGSASIDNRRALRYPSAGPLDSARRSNGPSESGCATIALEMIRARPRPDPGASRPTSSGAPARCDTMMPHACTSVPADRERRIRR